MKKIDFIFGFLFALATIFIGYAIILSNDLKATKQKLVETENKYKEYVKEYTDAHALTDWDMFTLALMKVESDYDSLVVSSAGAKGYFQITPIYVEEVNRIHGKKYVFEEVVNSFSLSYEVFTLMQEAHNKNYNMDEALKLHNGDNSWYHKRVYNEMDAIKKYENMRQMVKTANICHR